MRIGILVTGAILIAFGVIGYVYPVTSVGSVSDIDDLCKSAIGSIGKVLNEQVRENCQLAKYAVLGVYAAIGTGAILVIIGSIIKNNSHSNQPLSPQAKKAIIVTIGIIVAIIIGVIVYPFLLQPDIQASNLAFSAMKNPQLVKVLDQGRVSNIGNFHYTSSHDDTYFIIFSNEFSFISTKSVSATYTYNGQQNHQSFTIPPGAFKSIPIWIHSGQSIAGTFAASGGSGNDVDFNISTMTCTQTVNFSFSLSNVGQANGNADVAFEVDGKPVWSNRYSVDMGKQTSVSGSTPLADCNPHDYKIVVTSQQRTR